MTRVDEFDGFYASTRLATLAATYAKCGDRQVARDATIDAYHHAWRQWSRVSSADPAAFVREQAWQGTALSRGTHPLRRRRESGTDGPLLSALSELDHDTRRLIVLMTIAGLDLDEAATEVGVDDEVALEQASHGFALLEESLGVSLDEVAARLRRISEVIEGLDMPVPADLRRTATRGARRQTVALIATAVVATVLGGFLVVDGDASARQSAMPDRERIGSESRDIVLDSHNIGTDDLLTLTQVSELRPPATWTVEGTDTDPANTTPYATCPTTRFADPDPLKVFVRAYTNDEQGRATESIEVSRSEEASMKAYQQLVSSYAECEHPRVRLIDAYRVKRPFGDFQILRLQSYRSPVRFMTVGLAQSGTLTTTLIQETAGTKRSDVKAFAKVLNDSITQVCAESGGDCTTDFVVRPALPPPARKNPSFLGVVDLPPVADIDQVWSASKPIPVSGANPAATLCDKTTFAGASFVDPRSRLFAIPEAPVLPKQFALTQTVSPMGNTKQARNFMSSVAKRVKDCSGNKRPAKVDDGATIKGANFSGQSWRIGFEVAKDSFVNYRMGIVRRGAVVTQLLFPPAGKYAISADEFESVLQRAGQRLAYADQP